MSRRAVAAAAVVVPLLLLAGCGGAAEPDRPAREPGPALSASGADSAALGRTVVDFVDAFHGGRAADAYAFLSARCQEALRPSEWRAMTGEATATDGDDPLRDVEVRTDGRRGTVSYRLDVESVAERDQPWVREAGAWRNDDC